MSKLKSLSTSTASGSIQISDIGESTIRITVTKSTREGGRFFIQELILRNGTFNALLKAMQTFNEKGESHASKEKKQNSKK